jgi:predicted O-methyltransferase YrrM
MPRFLAMIVAILLASFSVVAARAAEEEVAAQPLKVESVLGREVRTARDEDGGRVIDLLFDEHGRVRAAVVEFGGFLGIGTRKIAVDWSAFRLSGRQILVDVTREQLRKAPEFKAEETAFVVKPPQE